MEYTPLKVSTMTWTAAVCSTDSSGILDLSAIFKVLPMVTDDDVTPGIVHLLNEDRTQCRPDGLFLGKKFGSNLTMRVRTGTDKQMLNGKLFANGCVQLTGAKSSTDAAATCELISEALAATGAISEATYFDLRVRMLNSDMRASKGIRRAYLYEKWRAETSSCIVFDPLTYPALKVLLFYDGNVGVGGQDGICRCSKHCSTKKNAKYRKCVKVTVSLFESGCIIVTGSVMPEEAESVRSLIIDKLDHEGANAYIVKEDPKTIMARILARHRKSIQGGADP